MKIPFWKNYKFYFIGLSLLVLIYILFLGNHSLFSRMQMKYKIKTTEKQIDLIKKENKNFRNELKSIKEDTTYQEILLRKLGYIRTNERLYKFLTPSKETNKIVQPIKKRKLSQRKIQFLVLIVLLLILILLYIFLLHYKTDKN